MPEWPKTVRCLECAGEHDQDCPKCEGDPLTVVPAALAREQHEALEGLLFMTINGVLCQRDDACRYCKPLWKKLDDALARYEREVGK